MFPKLFGLIMRIFLFFLFFSFSLLTPSLSLIFFFFSDVVWKLENEYFDEQPMPECLFFFF